ncbi:MAG: OmpA family protein, partial [bacterium]
ATNVSAANYWRYGASFSAKFGAFVPFVEGYGRKYVASALFEDQYIIYASGGMRFDTPAGLVIDLGSDYRITRFSTSPRPDTVRSNVYNINEGWSAVPDWRFHFGLSYYYDFIKDAAPIVIETKKTLVTGKIVDEENGEPLSAIVTMPGYSKDIRVTTDSTGTYSIEVNPGTIRIRVNREGYKWKEKGIIIEKGQTKIVDFTLVRKEEAKGTLEGKVVNKSDNEPIRATISFPNTDIPNIRSGSSTGKFRIDMEPGTYQMTVSKEGFIEWSQPVEIEQDKTLVMTIELLKKGGRINLVGIHFDSGKATIRPSSYPVLDRAVDMLKENPNVRIEIQGHTDSVGSASNNLSLSQARAESVRSYLINRGISASRIIAKGYGETMPIATNTTRYGRQQNRRIEFLILGD